MFPACVLVGFELSQVEPCLHLHVCSQPYPPGDEAEVDPMLFEDESGGGGTGGQEEEEEEGEDLLREDFLE